MTGASDEYLTSQLRDLTDVRVTDLVNLAGRVAVVTGGARGIGRAAAERLAEAGAIVLIGDLDADSAALAAAELSNRWGVETWGGALDVGVSASVDELADRADAMGAGLSVWVNNAAIYPAKPFLDVTDSDWASVIQVTLTGTFYGSRAAARRMVLRPALPGRVIINVSSFAGFRGRAGLSSYVAAKHGVSGLVRCLALELGAHGIRVLGIAPSVTKTPGTTVTSSLEKERAAEIPLGRSGVPDDVARLILYCASDLAEFVTGTIIPVDGGRSAF